MSEVIVRDNYDFRHWEPKLRFPGSKPVAVGYCRVSTDEQAEEGYSLDNQQEKVRQACISRFGKDRFHLVLIVEDASGTLPYNRGGMKKGTYREGLTLATEIFSRGIAKYLVIYKMSRLIRNARVWLELEQDFMRPNGVEIFAAADPVSNLSVASRFVSNIMAASAESERDTIATMSRDGVRARKEKLYFTGLPPFGWRWDDSRPARGSGRHQRGEKRGSAGEDRPRRNIEQDADAAPFVKKAFAWYREGKSPLWIAREFERCGVKTARDNSHWSAAAIITLLKHAAHAGLVCLDGELVEGRHFPDRIIEPAEYYATQERLSSRRNSYAPVVREPKHLFREFTTCGICGERMRVTVGKKGPRYYCKGSHGREKHSWFSAPVNAVEKRIIESIERLAESDAMLDAATRKIGDMVGAASVELDLEKERTEKELAKARDDLLRWCERFNRSEADDANSYVFTVYRDKLTKDITNLESRLQELRDKDRDREVETLRTEQAVEMLRYFPTLWETMDRDERRAFASYVIDDCSFHPDGNWVQVRLKLLASEPETLTVPVRGTGGSRAGTGLDSLTSAELTLAKLLLEGRSDREIAVQRDVSPCYVRTLKQRLLKKTGTHSLAEALAMLGPAVEEKKDHLLSRRRGLHYKTSFSARQVEILRLLAKRHSGEEIARTLRCKRSSIYSALEKLYRKLGVHSAREAVVAAQERNIIPGANPWSDDLTRNQIDVLRLLIRGMNQPLAASALGVTLSAVKERMRCMYTKFGVSGQEEMLSLANDRGWLDD